MAVNENSVTYLADDGTKVTGTILERSLFKLDIAITIPYSGLHTVGIMRPEYRNTEDFTRALGIHDCEVLLEELYYACKVMEDRATEFFEALTRFDQGLAQFDAKFNPSQSGLKKLEVAPGSFDSLIASLIQGMASKLEPAYQDERVELERQLYALIFKPLLGDEAVYQGYRQVPDYVRRVSTRNVM